MWLGGLWNNGLVFLSLVVVMRVVDWGFLKRGLAARGMLGGLVVLLGVYVGLRLGFREWSFLKLWFIYPVGVGVEWFFGVGEFLVDRGEWVYGVYGTRFVLGDSCSGTTFFSLLVAYFAYRVWGDGVAWGWVLLAYPWTLVINGMRVVGSMVADGALVQFGVFDGARDALHLGVGVVTFLLGFWCVVLLLEWSRGRLV